MEYQEIQEGFLLICNELRGQKNYPELMQLYNRSANLQDLMENGLEIDGIVYDFDLIEHIDSSKLILDQFVQNLLDSDAIVQGHRKITSAFATLKKQLVQKEEEKVESQIIIPQPLLIPVQPVKSELKSTKSTCEDLDEELQGEILAISNRMKDMALQIQEKLKADNVVINKIIQKQDTNQLKLKNEQGKLNKFMKSKSLSCSTLTLMLATSMCLFVFGILFIRIS